MRIKDWGQGLNKDQPPWELAPGFWSDCQNMRFRIGKAERCAGIAAVITPSGTPYWMQAYSSGTTRYVVYASLTKAYSHDGTTETEITRKQSGQTVTALTRSGSTVTVTTGANHGLSVGNGVTVYGAPTGGASSGINGSYSVASVPTGTTFTYTSSVSGSYTASSSALASIGYSLNSASILNFTNSADDKITGGNANGVLIYNNPIDGLFYWDQTSAGRLVPMQGFSGNKCDVARPFKNYTLCLAPTVSSVKYRHAVLWSAQADPGSVPLQFTASNTNDAGQQDCVSDGEMVDCREWGEDMILYKRDVRYRMRYIGGQFVFAFEMISGNSKDDGLLAANCIANTPKGQVFVTDGHDIRIHQGGASQSLANGRVLNYFRGAIDSTYRKRSFLALNPSYNEVWVCYPESGQTSCSKALIWNWEDDTWGLRDLSSVTSGTSGELPTSIATTARMLIANSTPKIGLVDSGTTDFGSSYQSMLERVGMDMDDPSYKMLSRSKPQFDASTNFTASIYHGAGATQDATPTYASPATYTHNTTTWVNAMSNSAPYLAWKMTTTAADTPTLRSIDFDIKTQGGF